MRRDAHTPALAVIAQAVVLADDLVALDVAHAERNSAVVAKVARGRDGAVGEP